MLSLQVTCGYDVFALWWNNSWWVEPSFYPESNPEIPKTWQHLNSRIINVEPQWKLEKKSVCNICLINGIKFCITSHMVSLFVLPQVRKTAISERVRLMNFAPVLKLSIRFSLWFYVLDLMTLWTSNLPGGVLHSLEQCYLNEIQENPSGPGSSVASPMRTWSRCTVFLQAVEFLALTLIHPMALKEECFILSVKRWECDFFVLFIDRRIKNHLCEMSLRIWSGHHTGRCCV